VAAADNLYCDDCWKGEDDEVDGAAVDDIAMVGHDTAAAVGDCDVAAQDPYCCCCCYHWYCSIDDRPLVVAAAAAATWH